MKVDLRSITSDHLLKERPDLFNDLRTEAFNKERQRILAIVKSTHSIFSHSSIEKELIVPIEMTALKEAWSLERFEKEVDALLQDTTGAINKLSHLDRAKLYQHRHGCSITDALKATAEQKRS